MEEKPYQTFASETRHGTYLFRISEDGRSEMIVIKPGRRVGSSLEDGLDCVPTDQMSGLDHEIPIVPIYIGKTKFSPKDLQI